MRSLLYKRISDDQTGEEAGIERQDVALRALSAKLGATVAEDFFDNDISAYSGKPRPGFEKLLVAIASGNYDVLIVWHVDRLYRSMKDLERIIEAAEKGKILIATVNSGELDLSTSAGRMIARILGSVARQESEHHAERRREANLSRALSGAWRREGSRPFGFNNDGTHREPEAAMIRTAVKDILGGKSIHAVARDWNASGVTTVRGVAWTNLHVRRVLTNPRVAALRVHQGKVVGSGSWEPIVDEMTWRGFSALLSDPSRKNALAFERKHLLSGIVRCGHRGPDDDPDDPHSICGRPLYAAHPHGKDRAMVYACKPTGHLGRSGAPLERLISVVVLDYLIEGGVGAGLREAEAVDFSDLTTQREALVATKDQLATLLRKGILDLPGVERESAILTSQIEEIDKQMGEAVTISPVALMLTDGDEDEAQELDDAEKLIEKWKKASNDVKGKIVAHLMDPVVLPAPRGVPGAEDPVFEPRWR